MPISDHNNSPTSEPIDAALPITAVTVLEDRAHVTRTGTVEIAEAGVVRLCVTGISPILSDKSLSVALESGAASVVESSVSRRRLFDPVPGIEPDGIQPERDRLLQELEELTEKIVSQERQRRLLGEHADGHAQLISQTLHDMADDASWGRQLSEEMVTELDRLRGAERKLRGQIVDLASEMREESQLRERLRARIDLLTDPRSHMIAEVVVTLAADKPGPVTLTMSYVVGNACWRPYHTAQLGGDEIDWRTDACVWQNTGEDWNQVDLLFSTERASLGTEPPELATDQIAVRRRSEKIEIEARDQSIQTAGLGAGPSASEGEELPGIDDGGGPLTLKATERSRVVSDGQPHRISVSHFKTRAEVSRVAFPELCSSVITKSLQENAGSAPILAGPVDLVRNSGLVGRSSVLFIAAGERFELGWGPDAELRLHRNEETSEDKSKVLSSWRSRRCRIEVRLSNLGTSRRQLVVTERVPVSEIDKVKIEVEKPGPAADKDGFVRWEVDLEPLGHKTLELSYTLSQHDDVTGL